MGEGDDWALSMDDTSDNFKVVVRVRPPLPRELKGYRPYQCTSLVNESHRLITLSENLPSVVSRGTTTEDGLLYATYRFTFDHVYDQDNTQEEVYQQSAKQVVLSCLQGYNAAIIAYGQTGTGKTYTMEGELQGPLRGIIPRTVEDIFTYIENDPEPSSKYLVRASYLQIYNEVISDLLKPEKTNLMIREDQRRGVFVDGLSEWVVRSPNEVYGLMMRGASQRATGATKMNEVSSRSHAVCIIIVENCQNSADQAVLAAMAGGWDKKSISSSGPGTQSIRVGKLNLVDLAGSERVHITGATGKRLEESKKINASLSALGNVIAALTDRKERQHIPYRDSKLTRILEDSLGGNCKTTMMCMISPAMEAFAESLSTLKFANRAKNIKNQAVINEDVDQRTLLRKYERELKRLRGELQRRNRELVDKRHLLEVEEQKRRAEADKLAALTALEKRSREFMREKEEKRALEQKISAMQSQLLVGGNKPEDVPALRALLAKEHTKIRGEYEARLRELEAERQMVEEDLAQVDRYKTLLLKQRDIMIALTGRLNERDEQIMTLQEELEAYDKHQRKLEDALDGKSAELIALRKAALEHAAVSPIKNTHLASMLGDWGAPGTPRSGLESRDGGESGAESPDLIRAYRNHGGTEVSQMLHSTSASNLQNLNSQAASLRLQSNQSCINGGEATAATAAALAAVEERDRAIARLEERNQQLAAQLREAEESAKARAAEPPSTSSAEWKQLQERVGSHVAERNALLTILESKVLPLADDLARCLQEQQDDSSSTAGGAGGGGGANGSSDAEARARRQVATLQRLLVATVTAMSKPSAVKSQRS